MRRIPPIDDKSDRVVKPDSIYLPFPGVTWVASGKKDVLEMYPLHGTQISTANTSSPFAKPPVSSDGAPLML